MSHAPLPSGSQPPRRLLLPRLVAAAFILSILTIAIASWEVTKGRSPTTASPLIDELLRTPDERRCTRDVSAVVGRFLTPGLSRDEARSLLNAAFVEKPAPLFWTVRDDAFVADEGAVIRFRRIMRFTAFGNQTVTGEVAMEGDRVAQVRAQMACPFN